jgi:hypothetical protein
MCEARMRVAEVPFVAKSIGVGPGISLVLRRP